MVRVEFVLSHHIDAMRLVLLLLLYVTLIIGSANNIIEKLRVELAWSKTAKHDSVLPFICLILPTPEFINAAGDQDFIISLLDELGFGALGVKRDSWAAKYQADPRKRLSCFATMYSIATSEISKTSLANLKKLIRRCCLSDNDL
jgi:hypothetical protein